MFVAGVCARAVAAIRELDSAARLRSRNPEQAGANGNQVAGRIAERNLNVNFKSADIALYIVMSNPLCDVALIVRAAHVS